MPGQPGHHTMEMNGGSAGSYLARASFFPVLVLISTRSGSRWALDFQGQCGIDFAVRWNLRLVISGVDMPKGKKQFKLHVNQTNLQEH